MNIRTILIMGIFMSLSWALVRFAAPYQKNIAQKYIVLPNAFLARCLLPKQRGYVKVADRRKISLFSLVFYGLFAVVSIALVLCFLLPEVPCETFTAYFGRKNTRSYEICTWNEKNGLFPADGIYVRVFNDRAKLRYLQKSKARKAIYETIART